MAAMPIYGKPLNLCTRVLPRLLKLLPWVDLYPFNDKVKFGRLCFCVGKGERY